MPTFTPQYRDVQFSMHQPLGLPRDTVKVCAEEAILFVSPDKGTYIATSAPAAFQVAHLLQGSTPAETVQATCAELNMTPDQALELLRGVLYEIETNQFYARAEVEIDTGDFDFPLLAYLTTRCNLRCIHCYMDAGHGSPDELTASEWKTVISDYSEFCESIQKRPRITFTGGEPLLRKEALTLIEHARNRGCVTELFTNGTQIRTEEDARRIAKCVDLAQLSLDGATEAVNDSIRGKGAFKAVRHAIDLLNGAGVKFRLAMTLMPANHQDMRENIVSLLRSIGEHVELRLALASIQGRAQRSVRFRDSCEGELALRSVLEPIYREGLRKPRRVTPNLRSMSCGYGRNIAISDSGTLYGCAIMEFPLGSVRQEPLADLASRAFQLGIDTQIDKIKGCNSCELRYLCAGLCRLNNWIYKQELTRSCCTPEKKKEVIKKLAVRQAPANSITGARPLVGSFWLAH